jgi:hypothetical protein
MKFHGIAFLLLITVILLSGCTNPTINRYNQNGTNQQEKQVCIEGKNLFDNYVSYKTSNTSVQAIAKIINVSSKKEGTMHYDGFIHETTDITLEGINETATITAYFTFHNLYQTSQLQEDLAKEMKGCECGNVSNGIECDNIGSKYPRLYCTCINDFPYWHGRQSQKCIAWFEDRGNIALGADGGTIETQESVDKSYWITNDDIGKNILVDLSGYGRSGRTCCIWEGHEFVDC